MHNIIYFVTLFCIVSSQNIYLKKTGNNVNSTLSDILKLTGKTAQDLPSDYEIIQIWYPKNKMSLKIHDKSYLSFYAFGKNITANLEPIQFNLIDEETPVWLADLKNTSLNLKKLPPFTIKQQFLWYATSENTVVGTGFDDGVPYFIGKVGNLSIIPLDKDESQKLRRRKRDIDNEFLPGTEDSTGSYLLSDYHKIYISSEKDDEKSVDFFNTITASLEKEIEMENMKFLKRVKRDSTDQQVTIQPKILLYVDYGSQFLEAKGILFNRFIMYLISFWNNVNIYFQHLKNPRVSLRITGIIIAMDDPAVPFFMQNYIGFSKIACEESLIDMNLWFHHHRHIISKDQYDIAITMTSRNLFQSKRHKRRAVDGAVKSSVNCQKNQQNLNATGIVHDMRFSGISTAVKELAYMINAGYKTSSWSDENICNLHDGTTFYVHNSSYNFYYQNPDNMFWLPCHSKPVCGYNEHFLDTGKPLPNILPGEIISLDEQCQFLGFRKSCKVHDNVNCNGFLWCEVKEITSTWYVWNSEKTVCEGVGLILDGTSCGKNKYCYSKKCVPYARDIWIQNVSD